MEALEVGLMDTSMTRMEPKKLEPMCMQFLQSIWFEYYFPLKSYLALSWSPLCDLQVSYNDSDKVDSSIVPGSIDITKFYFSQDGTNIKATMPGNSMSYKLEDYYACNFLKIF